MPVLFTRRDPNYITWMNFFDRAIIPTLYKSITRSYDEFDLVDENAMQYGHNAQMLH